MFQLHFRVSVNFFFQYIKIFLQFQLMWLEITEKNQRFMIY
jgi:hypothetical protein